jgi:hypothetical protein
MEPRKDETSDDMEISESTASGKTGVVWQMTKLVQKSKTKIRAWPSIKPENDADNYNGYLLCEWLREVHYIRQCYIHLIS